MRKNHSSGFTLIEMLVVIAIVAILVAIIVPTVTSSTTKAKAATDASNLRSALGVINVAIFGEDKPIEEIVKSYEPSESALNPESSMYAYYVFPGILEIYYVSGGDYYSLDYLSDLATNGETEISTAAPHPTTDSGWYLLGGANE